MFLSFANKFCSSLVIEIGVIENNIELFAPYISLLKSKTVCVRGEREAIAENIYVVIGNPWIESRNHQ